MLATIVPVQHPIRQSLRQTKVEDAFGVLGLEREFVVFVPILLVAGQFREEARGRQLSLITHNDHLAASCDGAKCIDRLDLRRLVHDEEIERNRPRLEELRYRERAHEKDRLDLLDDGCGAFQKLPYRKVISLFCDFTVQDTQRTDTASIPGQSKSVLVRVLTAREPHAFDIQLAEAFYQTPVSLAVETLKFRMLCKDDAAHRFEIRTFECGNQRRICH